MQRTKSMTQYSEDNVLFHSSPNNGKDGYVAGRFSTFANSRKLVFSKVLATDRFLNFIRCFILAAAPLSFHVFILVVYTCYIK